MRSKKKPDIRKDVGLFLYLRSAILQHMKKFQTDMTVARNRLVGPCATLLTLQYPGNLPDMVAGQFAELQVPSAKVLLRRPISIHAIDRTNNLVEFLNGYRFHVLHKTYCFIDDPLNIGNIFVPCKYFEDYFRKMLDN